MAFLLKMVKKDEDFYTKCWEVIVNGDSAIEFKKVLEQSPSIVNEKNPRGDTLLHQATLYARTQIIEVLLRNGSDINALDQYGDTPLFWALQYTPPSKRLECVVMLVNNGANIELGEQTPLWLAACYGYLPIVELLVEKGADTTALVTYSGKKFTSKEVAHDKGHNQVWQFLQFTDAVNVIKKGDNLNGIKKLFEQGPKIARKKDHNNYTLLHHAAFYGRSSIVQFLVSESDPNALNNSNETPLFCAVAENQPESAGILINASVDVDIADKDGCTAFWKAALTGQQELVTVLAKAGADILAPGTFREDGQTYSPKQIAKLKQHTSIEELISEFEINFIPRKSIPGPLQLPKSLPPPLPATVYNPAEDYTHSPMLRHLTHDSGAGLVNTSPSLPKSVSEVVPPRAIPNLDLSKMSKPREINRDPAGTPAYLRQSSSPAFFHMSRESPRDPSPSVQEILLPSNSDDFPDPRAPVELSIEIPDIFPDPRQQNSRPMTPQSPRPMTAPAGISPTSSAEIPLEIFRKSPRNSISDAFPDPRQSPRSSIEFSEFPDPRQQSPRPLTPPDGFPDPRSADLTPTLTPRDPSPNPARLLMEQFAPREATPMPPRAASHPLVVPQSVVGSATSSAPTSPTADFVGFAGNSPGLAKRAVLGANAAFMSQNQVPLQTNVLSSSLQNGLSTSLQSGLPVDYSQSGIGNVTANPLLQQLAMNQPVTLSMSPPAVNSPPASKRNIPPIQQTIGFSPIQNQTPMSQTINNLMTDQINNAKRFSVDDHQMSQNQKRISFEELSLGSIHKKYSQDSLQRNIGPSTNPQMNNNLLKAMQRDSFEEKAKLGIIPEVTSPMLSPRESGEINQQEMDILSQSPKRFFDSNGMAAKTRELHTTVQARFLPNIIPGDTVGKGQFGQVFKGIMDGSEVALKKFYQPNVSNEQWVLHLALETRHWVQLRHPNVVAFLGLYHDNVDSYYLCTEFVPLRSLAGFLRNPFYVSMLDALTLVKMAISATLGMIYLGERQIIHGNLATRNLMVFKEDENTYALKVDDYGITQDVSSETFKASEVSPFKWTAPEVFKTQTFTTQSDVWSFGVVLWEMFEPEKSPYQDMGYQETVDFLEKGFRMAVPENAPTEVQQLISECWRVTPEKRPTFPEILKRLDGITNHFVPLVKDGEIRRH